MNPKISTKPEILNFIQKKGKTTAKEIEQNFEISKVSIFKHLKSLVEREKVKKVGSPPKVYYIFNNELNRADLDLNKDFYNNLRQQIDGESLEKLIQNKYLYVSVEGNLEYGVEGFRTWCEKQNLPFEKTVLEYQKTWEKYLKFYKKNDSTEYVDATFKLNETFQNKSSTEKLFYLDFYAIERFGKTKLALLTFQAKQSQDAGLIKEIISIVKQPIQELISANKIEAVAFIPPTVKRRVQLMDLLEKELKLDLPKIKIEKIIYDTPVQQKTLKSKSDRVENASKTFYIPEQARFDKVMLIDDFIGSGATINQIAEVMKEKNIAKSILGLGLTGSFNGFEVINQV